MADTLSLKPVVDIEVNVSPAAAPRRSFNQGLIIGDSAIIPALERIRLYTSVADMLADGFANDDPEYLAALLYFSQVPAPTFLWVGRQDAAESPLQAVQACRQAGPDWYCCTVCGAAKADHIAIAAYIEAANPTSVYMFTTSDADALAGTEGNVFESLKGASYSRSFGQYSTHANAVAAIMGRAMGLNSGLANSAFTLKFKQEVGVTPQDLTATQAAAIEADHGNVYVNRGSYYNMFEQGVMADGQFFDEVLNLDMLANAIQLNVMDLLYGVPKVPQTEPGVTQIINAVNQACDQAVQIGFLAPGLWTGRTVLSLKPGDVLPKGYLVQAQAIADQATADREARKAPNIYACVKEAGAVHSVTIGVYVNR